jgi:antitoxin component of MazEF toxin-antitoxin module
MSRKRINVSENPSTLLLPQQILDEMGVVDGDEVDVAIVDRTVILTPLDEVERAQKLGTAIKSLFERRKRAYQELAKGAD